VASIDRAVPDSAYLAVENLDLKVARSGVCHDDGM
jgi:hypothetical protein